MADLSIPVNVYVLTRYRIDYTGDSAFTVVRVYLEKSRADADFELVLSGEGDDHYKLDTVPLIVK